MCAQTNKTIMNKFTLACLNGKILLAMKQTSQAYIKI